MSADRDALLRWVAAGELLPAALPAAMRIAGVVPSPERWRAFLAHACTWLGAALLAAAATSFVAANWEALGRFAKFALVQGAIVAALAIVAWRGLDALAGRVSLFAAAVLMGVLLALVGQVYQTGADTFELFAVWALAIVAWVVLGRQPALWLLWLALLNVAIALWFRTSVARGVDALDLLFMPRTAWWVAFVLDVVALALWEWLDHRRGATASLRWPMRVLATVAGVLVTCIVVVDVAEPARPWAPLSWAVYAAWIGALYWAYGVRARDLFMLSGMLLSLVAVTAAALGRPLIEHGGALGFLLVGLLLIACAVAGGYWLRRVHADGATP